MVCADCVDKLIFIMTRVSNLISRLARVNTVFSKLITITPSTWEPKSKYMSTIYACLAKIWFVSLHIPGI